MHNTISLERPQHIHLVGIGGIGMSALVPLLLKKGYSVTGSDPSSTPVTDRLKAMGVCVYHEHRAENINGVTLLIVSSAIPASNPEIQSARELAIPVWPRARMLGWLLNGYRAIAVTGAHGKTTVTGMTAKMLTDCGLDPTAFIGGDISWLGGNTRIGQSEWAVAEGDESDGSFTFIKPEIALINNIDADHLDFYTGINAIIEQFQRFISGVRNEGWIIWSADSPACRQAVAGCSQRCMSYGFAPDADLRGENYSHCGGNRGCDVYYKNECIGHLRLSLNGQFNYHNALGVLAIALAIHLPVQPVLSSLAEFTGVQRRMEVKGIENGITVIDDYAHHPAEIAALIQGLKEKFAGRLIGIFQPHLYSRTQKLAERFGTAFTGLDELILTDIYPAREKPLPGVTGELLVDLVKQSGVSVTYIPLFKDIVPSVLNMLKEGDCMVTIGAGSIWQIGENLLQILHQKKEESGR